MKNVETTVKGNILTITVDLSRTFGKSKSGKTTIIATTEGAESVAGMDGSIIRVNLNVYK
jgi:hypothetical protein